MRRILLFIEVFVNILLRIAWNRTFLLQVQDGDAVLPAARKHLFGKLPVRIAAVEMRSRLIADNKTELFPVPAV